MIGKMMRDYGALDLVIKVYDRLARAIRDSEFASSLIGCLDRSQFLLQIALRGLLMAQS